MDQDQQPPTRLAWGLLAAGMLAGLILALWGLHGRDTPGASSVAATVNGEPIASETYSAALAALQSDKRAPLTDADRARVLERLVDEELLVQHALRLGMARRSPAVRGALVGAVLDLGRAQADSQVVDDAQARAFFETQRGYFRRRGQRHVRAWQCADEDCARRTERALAAGSVPGAPRMALPDGRIPDRSLSQYLGDALAATARAMRAGEVRVLEGSPGGPVVLQVLEVYAGEVPPFDAVRETVAAEIRRRESEAGLRDLLETLRSDAAIKYPHAP